MRLKPLTPFCRLARDEHGFTMVVALMVMLIGSLLAAAAFVATNEDVALTRSYTSQQKAYFAAEAGIAVYKYQLTANPNYWQTCPKTEASPAPTVPGTTDESYEYKTLGANKLATCTSGKQATIIETSGTASGTFRVESTGFSGGRKRSVVATFTHPGFLNYAWVSNFEVEDPSTFTPVPTHCNHYYKERKEIAEGKVEIEGKKFPEELKECPGIPFINGDEILGPFHTNDAVSMCDIFGVKPTFGRAEHNPPDKIEMNGGTYKDVINGGCGEGYAIAKGAQYTEKGATLFPPSTDNELLETAEYKFEGRTIIELEAKALPNTMTVTTYNFAEKKFVTEKEKPFPKNGVIYVGNKEGCPVTYSPFVYDKNYTEEEEKPNCGTVYIKGKYTQSLTIAAQKDVVIIGNVTTTTEGEKANAKPTENATLGLIANGFVRIYHPVTTGTENKREPGACNANNQNAAEDFRKWGSIKDPVVDAAILSTNHSWIVDNFMCGSELGTLTVWGVIAQEWRGRVTAGAGKGGYLKNYNYDERFKTKQPPNFLSPTTTDWKVTRETQPPTG